MDLSDHSVGNDASDNALSQLYKLRLANPATIILSVLQTRTTVQHEHRTITLEFPVGTSEEI